MMTTPKLLDLARSLGIEIVSSPTKTWVISAIRFKLGYEQWPIQRAPEIDYTTKREETDIERIRARQQAWELKRQVKREAFRRPWLYQNRPGGKRKGSKSRPDP